MKRIFPLVILAIATSYTFGQQIPAALDGQWMGTLNVGVQLRIVFHFEVEGDSIFTVLDSPDQSVKGIPTESTSYFKDTIKVIIPVIKGSFIGVYSKSDETIYGDWVQGAAYPLNLIKTDTVAPVQRPQNPVKPYPYKTEDVVFQNTKADSVSLAGTISIPEGTGPFPAVILVTGSGAQDRNESLLGHQPFLVLSDYLTRHGILVLRYDDRGYAASTGNYFTATSMDFASDASAAVDYLKGRKDLPISRIGIAGHSEGGLIAPIVAAQNKNVDFIVLMAGPGLKGDSLLSLQGNLIAKASGMNDSTIADFKLLRNAMMQVVEQETDMDMITQKLIEVNKTFISSRTPEQLRELGLTLKDSLSGVSYYANPWMKYFLSYDPRPVLEKTKIPVLAINGTKDLQVPCTENLTAIDTALKKAGNKNYKTVAIPNLNHLFQTSTTGAPSEYSTIEETFNEGAMQTIADWVLALKK